MNSNEQLYHLQVILVPESGIDCCKKFRHRHSGILAYESKLYIYIHTVLSLKFLTCGIICNHTSFCSLHILTIIFMEKCRIDIFEFKFACLFPLNLLRRKLCCRNCKTRTYQLFTILIVQKSRFTMREPWTSPLFSLVIKFSSDFWSFHKNTLGVGVHKTVSPSSLTLSSSELIEFVLSIHQFYDASCELLNQKPT